MAIEWDNGWKKRKEQRAKAYWKQHGLKLEECGACSGSGYYDHNGHPKCSACNGTGKTRQSKSLDQIAREYSTPST